MTLLDGSRLDGTFARYHNGKFEFRIAAGKLQKASLIRVASLTLAPPVDANVRRRVGRAMDGLTFVNYTNSDFHFLRSGQPLALPSAQVAAIDPVSNMQREMQHVAASDAARDVRPHDASFEIPIATGRVTVVHFNRDDVMSSVRQGTYLRNRCEQSHGKLVYERIDIKDRADPVAIRYQINSIPQFWFYDRSGVLSSKLTERFTEEDIDQALSKAR